MHASRKGLAIIIDVIRNHKNEFIHYHVHLMGHSPGLAVMTSVHKDRSLLMVDDVSVPTQERNIVCITVRASSLATTLHYGINNTRSEITSADPDTVVAQLQQHINDILREHTKDTPAYAEPLGKGEAPRKRKVNLCRSR